MFLNATSNTAPFNTKFFHQQILLLSVGENMIQMGYWTVISKEPFRFLVCMQLGNYSLGLIRKYQEAVLHFFPWKDREWIFKAGNISGRDDSPQAGANFLLKHTRFWYNRREVEGTSIERRTTR
ncbi:MAG: hypothetical protein HN736_01255 [Anaerolineae bacterium]|nr:hypothetical protein [Anaerolineae bacterium]MBT4310256.1 hypothetical protein [Anaerolineae bacterium]MBT4460240.1 hypothetical protein [Anaerolineae bacterium]MBT4842165.1 hypothetical protein [Anaerolineae bacterium]MBT6063095.1 hypothetical protein [Anaerolineae bacterium]